MRREHVFRILLYHPPLYHFVSVLQQSHIHSFIRWFEPLVIRALKEYTLSSSVILQQQVLSLLAQLIKLRVNYSLLDAGQVSAKSYMKTC